MIQIIKVFLILLIPNFLFSQVKELSVEDQLMFTTVQIKTYSSESKQKGSGTGFFCELKTDTNSKQFIITNRHVISGADFGILTFKKSVNGVIDKNPVSLQIPNFESEWISHPEPKVDLVALELSKVMDFYNKKGIEIYPLVISEDIFVDDSTMQTLSILENVVMIGYPNGLSDTTNNSPIARTGVTASIPRFDYLGTKDFLIDIVDLPFLIQFII